MVVMLCGVCGVVCKWCGDNGYMRTRSQHWKKDVPYHRDALQALQPAFRHRARGDRCDGYDYDYGSGVVYR